MVNATVRFLANHANSSVRTWKVGDILTCRGKDQTRARASVARRCSAWIANIGGYLFLVTRGDEKIAEFIS